MNSRTLFASVLRGEEEEPKRTFFHRSQISKREVPRRAGGEIERESSMNCDTRDSEHKFGMRVGRHLPALSWLPAHVADVIGRHRLERDVLW